VNNNVLHLGGASPRPYGIDKGFRYYDNKQGSRQVKALP